MSVTPSGVKMEKTRVSGKAFLFFLIGVEAVLSIFVYISLAANIIWPEKAAAVLGVAKVLSYEGRLTDSSGNPLGGAGTAYCFKFSIYDDATVGAPDTKLWPTGAPTGQSITVTDGVFDALIGSADTLDYNFYSNDTVYLNVETATKVGASCTDGDETYETMGDRQRIAATGYAISAANVYSDLLKTDISAGNVQIGSGTGAATPKLLALDVKNTSDTIGAACSPSGSVWYNSNNTQALVCTNGVIRPFGNPASMSGFKESGASATINAGTLVFSNDGGISISQSTATLATNQTNQTIGTLRFSNLNAFGVSNLGNTLGNTGSRTGTIVLSGQGNITLSQITGAGGATIGISAAGGGGGGGGATISHWPPFPIGIATSSNNTGTTAAGTNITASFQIAPLQLEQALSYSRINIAKSYGTIVGTGSVSIADMLGIYTLNGGTALSLSTSYMFRQEISQSSVTAQSHRWYWGTNSTANSASTGGNVSSLMTGVRAVSLLGQADSLSAGQYYLVYVQTNRSSSANIMPAASMMYVSQSQSQLAAGQIGSANFRAPFPLIGRFSSTTAVGNFTTPFMPSSINTTAITNTGTNSTAATSLFMWPAVTFVGK